jgi:hypothetical protein
LKIGRAERKSVEGYRAAERELSRTQRKAGAKFLERLREMARERGGGRVVQVVETAKVSALIHRADEAAMNNLKNIWNLVLTVNESTCRIGVRL